ncbi:MAG: pallilysin-related adhesin [Spirochaetales bacterium]|nr:pallilysin-related adhesin [Spirochaetales bacterium]
MKNKIPFVILLCVLLGPACAPRIPDIDSTEADIPGVSTRETGDTLYADSLFSEGDDSLSADLQSKVPLAKNEFLLQTINVNLDLDIIDEQILIIKIVDDPELFIKLVVVEFDEVRNTYVRSWESFTNATNHRVFDLECIDIVGDYSKEIVFSGMNNKDVTLDVFRRTPSPSHPGLYFVPICRLVSNGTITIQRKKRSASYELGQKTGESFPIVIERTDKDSGNANDLIRETYQWVYASNKYEFIPPSERIPGDIIEDKKFRELLSSSGTAVFEEYLEGAWYNKKDISQMILFFPDEQQIVFYSDNAQEVYSWDYSSRRSSYLMLLMIRNILVRSIKLTLNITCKSLSSINISMSDDFWAGDYVKVKEELQESLYSKESVVVKPSEVQLSGIFEEEFPGEDKSIQIIFEPPYFTWTDESNDSMTDYSGGFAVLNNVPVINDFYYQKHFQNIPDELDEQAYDDLIKKISSQTGRLLFKQSYLFDKASKNYLVKPNIDSTDKTELWKLFVSTGYKGFREYAISVISFKILKENGLIDRVENYLLEYVVQEGIDGNSIKKVIVFTPARLLVNGIEAVSQDSFRLVQHIEKE